MLLGGEAGRAGQEELEHGLEEVAVEWERDVDEGEAGVQELYTCRKQRQRRIHGEFLVLFFSPPFFF